MGQNNSYAKNWFSIYTYPKEKKKSVFVEKEKHDLLFHCKTQISIYVWMFLGKGKRGKKERKKDKETNKYKSSLE